MTDKIFEGKELSDEELNAISGGTGEVPFYAYWCSKCKKYVFWSSELEVCPECGEPLSPGAWKDC